MSRCLCVNIRLRTFSDQNLEQPFWTARVTNEMAHSSSCEPVEGLFFSSQVQHSFDPTHTASSIRSLVRSIKLQLSSTTNGQQLDDFVWFVYLLNWPPDSDCFHILADHWVTDSRTGVVVLSSLLSFLRPHLKLIGNQLEINWKLIGNFPILKKRRTSTVVVRKAAKLIAFFKFVLQFGSIQKDICRIFVACAATVIPSTDHCCGSAIVYVLFMISQQQRPQPLPTAKTTICDQTRRNTLVHLILRVVL